MTRRAWIAVLIAVAGSGLRSAGAQAQGIGGAPSAPGYGPGALGNPYANPYMNPFLNPYMTQTAMGRNSALYYLLAAQQTNGGLGSGQLSGVRPGPGTAGARKRSAAEMPKAMTTAGGGAGRYFQRGPAAPENRGSYFLRHNRYFASNGR